MTLLVETGQELLHTLYSLSACHLPSSFLDLVVLQVAESLNHEACARTERPRILGQLLVNDLDDALEGTGVVLPQLLSRV